jgi:hypothetical protein
VYAWFLTTYKVSVFVGMTGYFLLVLDMFGVGLLLARYVEQGERAEWCGGEEWAAVRLGEGPKLMSWFQDEGRPTSWQNTNLVFMCM